MIVVLGSPLTRWASIAFGAGVGIGSAYAECSRLFDGPPTKLALPKVSETATQVVFVFYFLIYIYNVRIQLLGMEL